MTQICKIVGEFFINYHFSMGSPGGDIIQVFIVSLPNKKCTDFKSCIKRTGVPFSSWYDNLSYPKYKLQKSEIEKIRQAINLEVQRHCGFIDDLETLKEFLR